MCKEPHSPIEWKHRRPCWQGRGQGVTGPTRIKSKAGWPCKRERQGRARPQRRSLPITVRGKLRSR
eukprot:9937945-Heterocapsa_arctica.AAC.1